MSSSTLERVYQTNRTILFEVFDNQSSRRLDTLLTNEWDNGIETFEKKLIEEGLTVKSFKEFLEKFKPVLYQTSFLENDKVVFNYSTEKPSPNVDYTVIDITEQPYYKMILKLYEQKGSSGKNNIDFDYNEIKKIITPERVTEEIKTVRRNLEYNYNQILKLEKSNAPATEINRYKKKFIDIRKDIMRKYKGANFLNLIPLALADTENKLKALPQNDNQIDNKQVFGTYTFDNNGDVKFIESSKIEENTKIGIEEKSSASGELLPQVNEQSTNLAVNSNQKDFVSSYKPLSNYIQNDFKNQTNDFVRNLIVSSYVADYTPDNELSKKELQSKKELYQNIYRETQESFIKSINSLLEKIMNVKIFFEHATDKSNPEAMLEQSDLIIANCTVSDIINGEVKDKFEQYIEGINSTPKSKIWYAIIPGLNLECNEIQEQFDSQYDYEGFNDDMDNLGDDDDNHNSEHKKSSNGLNLVTQDDLKSMLNILYKNNIVTFFSPKGCERTGFSKLNDTIIKNYKNACESIDNNSKEYSVFCYPNFTILPKKEEAVEFGSDAEGKPIYLNVNGVFVDSCYVACGMVVASQNPKLLKSKKFKVDTRNVCVRFDLEDDKYNKKMLTKINRENLLNWSKNIKNAIDEDSFGFCFCSDEIYYENNKINNSYIYNARTLQKDSNGKYRSIYKTLMKIFIHVYVHTFSKITVKTVDDFINNEVREWKREAGEFDNSILAQGEKISFNKEDEPKISIQFNSEDIILNNIDIMSDDNGNDNND